MVGIDVSVGWRRAMRDSLVGGTAAVGVDVGRQGAMGDRIA